jgi:NADPH:quinone reductase-like Zn-dependent oxidoreductase
VTGLDTAAKLELVRQAGADHALDHTRHDFTRGDRRYDYVLDIAPQRSMRSVRRALDDDGVYVPVPGSMARFAEAAGYMLPTSVTGRRRVAMFQWRPGAPGDLDTLRRLLEEGALRVVVDRTCSLDDVPEALRDLEAGRLRGKAVVVP